jgi:hypothetical protein
VAGAYPASVRTAPAFLAFTFVVAFAGCGGSPHDAATTTVAPASPAATVGAGAKTLYRGSAGWAVVQQGSKAVALHLVDGGWRPDRSGAVHVSILGPHGTAPPQAQVAAEISAPTDLAESALWVDGEELLVKGGGTARKGTIYGTTSAPLDPGPHVAVAFGRTAVTATAVAWTFRVS